MKAGFFKPPDFPQQTTKGLSLPRLTLKKRSKPSSLLAALMVSTLFILILPQKVYPYERLDGRSIEGIRFVGFEKFDLRNLTPLIDIKKGDLYSSVKVRNAIKRLYLKKLFSLLYVDASEGESGVILSFHAEPRRWISDIVINGNKVLWDDKILRLLPSKMGDEYNVEILPAIKKKMKEIYEREGYYNTEVNVTVIDTDLSADIVINLEVGPPCLLSDILFSGSEAIPSSRLLKTLDSRMNRRLNLASLEKDRKKLVDLYHQSGYLEVSVSDADVIFDDGKKKTYALYMITEGAKTDITFRGNSSFSDSQLMKMLKIREESLVNNLLVDGWEEIIKEQYLNKGFPFVQVAGTMTGDNGEKRIVFTIDEGPRYVAGEVTITGNETVSRDDLLKVISLKGRLSSKPFSESEVDSTVEAIRQLYMEKGFADAIIKKNISFREDLKKVDIDFLVLEGVQTVVENVEIAIDSDSADLQESAAFDKDELMKTAGLNRGAPFNKTLEKNASVRLVEAYSKKGYIYATVKSEKRFSQDGRGVEIKFTIEEGEQVRRGKVIISGNRNTKDRIILRELTLKENDLFDREKALHDRHRIHKLGLFRRVRYSEVNKEKKEAVKDMHLEVSEKKAGSVELGLGYATDIGPRAFSELSYLNLWGTARSIRIRGEISPIENKALIGYMEPWLFGKDMDGRINLLHQSKERDSYDLKKDGLILGIDKEVSDYFKVSLQYEIDRSVYSDVQTGTIQDEGASTIASLGPILIRDSREDPFNPDKGSVNILRYELADKGFSSDEEFHKITVQSNWYRAITADIVGAFSIKGGYIDLREPTVSIPIDKRFFLGGRSTVRGFKQDSIGPVNPEGSAIGGEKMLNYNAELRMRLAGNFGGILFYDAGNVWQHSQTVHLSDMRTAIGAGIRYLTPVGPLSLEYGHKLDRKKDESSGEWYFTIGNIF